MKSAETLQVWNKYPTQRKIGMAVFVVYVILIAVLYNHLKSPVYPEVSMVLEMVKGLMVLAIAVSGACTIAEKKFKTTVYRVVKGAVMLQTGLLIIKWSGDDVYSVYKANPSSATAFLVSGVITYFLMKRVLRGSFEPSTTSL